MEWSCSKLYFTAIRKTTIFSEHYCLRKKKNLMQHAGVTEIFFSGCCTVLKCRLQLRWRVNWGIPPLCNTSRAPSPTRQKLPWIVPTLHSFQLKCLQSWLIPTTWVSKLKSGIPAFADLPERRRQADTHRSAQVLPPLPLRTGHREERGTTLTYCRWGTGISGECAGTWAQNSFAVFWNGNYAFTKDSLHLAHYTYVQF